MVNCSRSREGAWIEIALPWPQKGPGVVAPARERGLKWFTLAQLIRCYRVAPARERGLKYQDTLIQNPHGNVAPARERGLK